MIARRVGRAAWAAVARPSSLARADGLSVLPRVAAVRATGEVGSAGSQMSMSTIPGRAARSVLVGVDGSPGSRTALERALDMMSDQDTLHIAYIPPVLSA